MNITKTCPCCGAAFVCTGDRFCQCTGINLSDDARARIRSLYADCLCRNCLLTFAHE